ncbi:hypothetical protein H0H81_010304 [Sphagnurus paluster]|uniref:MI domain-containing protein n=1 Tax=Sphagnurus paluster TaxID=117069 RepID=A0A9P7K2L1_9AGAR|nr:hypothetical protein H0H81_010304 [Sphagnurus paluster]
MPVRKKTSTTRLPQALKDELEESTSNDHPRSRLYSRPKVSRKEARKEQRLNRKKQKAEHFSSSSVHNKRPAEEDHAESPIRKKIKHDDTPLQPGSTLVKPSVTPSEKKKNAPTKLEKLTPKTTTPRVLNRRADEEDAYIAYLETKLGYAKGGKKKKSTEDDGLDDLLDFTESLVNPFPQEDGDEKMNYRNIEDSSDEEEGHKVSAFGSEDEEWGGIEDDSTQKEENLPLEETTSVPQSATPYVPPHLRKKEPVEDSEEVLKLKRQLKGLLNRMSEQNMGTILDSIEVIYRDHRRNDVTSTITTLVIDGIASHSSLLDSYVVLYAAFVSSLHKIIGIEFAATFVQNVISIYEKHFSTALVASRDSNSEDNEAAGGKECSNLIVLLSELYNFQVISSVLIFDIIRGLLDSGLSEFCVELLLKVVRNSGQQLRQDDPSALKDIIQIVQGKVSGNDDALSSRTRFMIETLMNLKNNKIKRNVTQNQGAESVERMKKFLIGLAKKKHGKLPNLCAPKISKSFTVLAHEPLRVSLEDLHSAATKGKWWLVGAAWGGDPLVDKKAEKGVTVPEASDPDGDLSKLARKQGMNTDIRRSIFVVLMSSDDYVDACERLSQLNLTEVQQREIVRVLLHCCGNEKTYNPYYTLVCQHLCRTSHSYKITLQFCLWDFFRDLGETSVGGAELVKNLKEDDGFDVKNISTTRIHNVAKAYGWWIAKDCVTLTILKPVDFTVLKPTTKDFLKELLIQIFFCSQRATPMISINPEDVPVTRDRKAVEEIFIKATRIQSLAMGLVYFISESFRTKEEDELLKLIKWASGLAKDTLRSGVDIIPDL